jgi:hypothetical protein
MHSAAHVSVRTAPGMHYVIVGLGTPLASVGKPASLHPFDRSVLLGRPWMAMPS